MPGNRALAMFALAALLLAMPAALAQVPPEAPVIEPLTQPAGEQVEEQAEGEVSAVENNTITVSTADGGELVLKVTESTMVTKEGVEELGMGSAGLEQIAEGDSVLVSYNPETMEALSIDLLSEEPSAEEPEEESAAALQQDENDLSEAEVSAPAENGEAVEGKVTGVNTNNNFLVIQTPEGKYLAFRLTNGTVVMSEAGQEAGIEDLSFGVNVSVEYDAQTKNVLEITVLSAQEGNVSISEEEVSTPLPEQPEDEAAENGMDASTKKGEVVEGEVSAVENNTITLSTAEGEELVLKVTESTMVTKEGVEELGMNGLEQIAEGDKVLVSYNPETMEALSIDVLPEEPGENVPLEP